MQVCGGQERARKCREGSSPRLQAPLQSPAPTRCFVCPSPAACNVLVAGLSEDIEQHDHDNLWSVVAESGVLQVMREGFWGRT